jgi:periplasmic copper chaperone A
MRRRARFTGVLVAVTVTLLGCSAGDDAPLTTQGTPDLRFSAVQSSAPIAGASQLVLDIDNVGDGADRLLAARTDVALAIEVHLTEIEPSGRAVMRLLDQVELPAGSTTRFRPGGLHLMLIVPDASVTPGGTFAITLEFERSAPVTLEVTVVELLDLLDRIEGADGAPDA